MQLRRIAAIDDQPASVAMFSEAISQVLEAEAVPYDDTPATPERVAAWVRERKIDAVLIDQDLRKGGYGHTSGISIAAALFKQHTPTILTTMHRMADLHDAIWYRRYLPSFLQKNHLADIEEAMGRAVAEIEGRVPAERKAYRTVVRIDEVDSREAQLVIPAFDYQEWITVAMDELAERLQTRPEAGMRFMAQVNIGALSQDELFISDIEA